MIKDRLSPDIVEFIQRYINSLEELEILVLFSSDPEKQLTLEEVNDHLRSSTSSIQTRLKNLTSMGFLVGPSEGKYSYKPKSEDLNAGVQMLCSAYKERRLSVIEAIFSKPLAGIREFAEAFKFKGGKDE